MKNITEDFAVTDAGIAGTGDSRLPPNQRDPAYKYKKPKKKLRQVFKRIVKEDDRG